MGEKVDYARQYTIIELINATRGGRGRGEESANNMRRRRPSISGSYLESGALAFKVRVQARPVSINSGNEGKRIPLLITTDTVS